MKTGKLHKWVQGLSRRLTLRSAIHCGLVLLILVTSLAGHRETVAIKAAAEHTMTTLKQQCISYDKLMASDRTKSLFRLSDLMREFSSRLVEYPELISDENLERYVDGMRVSGVALLNEKLELEASGYTRRFQNTDWMDSPDGSRFADIVASPAKVYMDRVEVDGEYYDICAVARKDAPGIVVGFYHQPSGLITGTDSDLKSLISGLHLEKNGAYIISEDGTVRVSSSDTLPGVEVSENTLTRKLAQVPKDEHLHLVGAEGRYYLSYRSGCENYSLSIYYPVSGVFFACLTGAAIFAAAFSLLLLLFMSLRNRALRQKQSELEESNRGLTQTLGMLRALETIFFSLFYVDLEQDTYESIYIAPWLVKVIPRSGRYTELKKTFLDTMAVPSFRETLDYRMSDTYIRETLNIEKITDARKSFYTDYQAIRGSEIKWCRVTATVVDYNEDGQPHHVLALLQDVDEDKKREADYQEQILKEAEEAKIANRAKTDFLRRISHDIRTPINGILGYIDMAKRHPDDMELQAHCRDNSAVAIHALLDLVNSVLDMSKIESGDFVLEEKPFDLAELLEHIHTILAPQAEAKQVRYDAQSTQALPAVHLMGSPLHLNQVLVNIAGNAVKYTRPGGYVRMTTELIEKTEDTVTYEFVCADNGIGMSEEFQRHMYEPFTQESIGARTTYEGVGLGLSITNKLVKAMGGTLTCVSKKDVGTTFRVRMTFPLDKTASSLAELPEDAEQRLLDGKNILLAEDNALNMEIAEMLLTERGAHVTRAWNGREAVEKFAASPVGCFDLIFMDIMMPEMNGLEATRAIRALERPDAKTVPISAMSANAFQDDIQNSINAGMNAHISKPVDDRKFIAVANELLSGRKHSSADSELTAGIALK